MNVLEQTLSVTITATVHHADRSWPGMQKDSKPYVRIRQCRYCSCSKFGCGLLWKSISDLEAAKSLRSGDLGSSSEVIFTGNLSKTRGVQALRNELYIGDISRESFLLDDDAWRSKLCAVAA